MEADQEPQLLEARRERFFVRSQLKVLRRYRERELRELDETVEGMRARLGRPHRDVPNAGE